MLNVQTDNILKIWDTLKKKLMNNKYREKTRNTYQAQEIFFHKIIEETVTHLKKEVLIMAQGEYRRANRHDQKSNTT